MKYIVILVEAMEGGAVEPEVDTAAKCVRNSFGPIQSLKPDGFIDATRIKYAVSGDRSSITYVIPEMEIL